MTIKRAASRREKATLDEPFFAALCRSSLKEISRVEKECRKDLIETDHEIKSALTCVAGCEAFLHEHGLYLPGARNLTVEIVVEALRQATVDDKNKEDKKQIERVLKKFEGDIEHLLVTFCEIARIGILKRDDMGKFLISVYGRDAKDTLERSQNGKKRDKELEEIRTLLRSFLEGA